MTDLAALLHLNAIEVFDQRDSLKRDMAMTKLWLSEARFHTDDGVFVGLAAISAYISDLFGRCPEYESSSAGAVNEVVDAAYIRWTSGSPGIKPAYTGTDLVVIEYGQIALICRFPEGPVW